MPESKLAFKLRDQQLRYLPRSLPKRSTPIVVHRPDQGQPPHRSDRDGDHRRRLRVIASSSACPARDGPGALRCDVDRRVDPSDRGSGVTMRRPRRPRDHADTGDPSMNSLWLAGLLALLPPIRPRIRSPPEGTPASTNIRGAEYPRILDDLRVTFRIKAPDAQKVEFGFFDNTAVRRDEGRRRLLDRHHPRPLHEGVSLLHLVHRWREGQRPGQPQLLRLRPGHQRHRRPRPAASISTCRRMSPTAGSALGGTSHP